MADPEKISMVREVWHGLDRLVDTVFVTAIDPLAQASLNLYERKGWRRLCWLIGAVVVAAVADALIALMYGAKDTLLEEKITTAVRNYGLLIVAIVGVGFGIWRAYTAHLQTAALQIQANTAEQGHITDRFSTAVEHLGSEQLPVRLGGIYALWRLTEDSAARDVISIIEILCAYVRNPPHDLVTPWAAAPHTTGQEPGNGPLALHADANPPVRPDVLAILNLIGNGNAAYFQQLPKGYRRDLSHANLTGAFLPGANLSSADLFRANLTSADLGGADLTDAYLEGTNFYSAHLTNANLTSANLTNANLIHANLIHAHLSGADLSTAYAHFANLGLARLASADLGSADLSSASLSHADLSSASLSHADLAGADLSHADLAGADLTNANLSGANLSGTFNLTQAQIDSCRPSPPPRSLSDHLTWPFEEVDGEWVQKK